jgi:pimeloyl-ACP methyl ester carboxylesterase
MSDVCIPIGRRRVRGKLFAPTALVERNPAVLFVHGWGGSQRRDIWKGRMLVGLGCVCLTFNLRGHGGTKAVRDRVTRAHSLDDVRAAYDVLLSQPGVDPERVALVGSSYGAYIAVLLTAERKVRWLVLRAPAIYKDEGFDRPKRQLNMEADLRAYRETALRPSDTRVLRAASRFRGDVLVVESERDHVIPHQVIDNYLRAFGAAHSATHLVIRGADHALETEAWRSRYGRILRDWFREQLGVDAPSVRRPRRTRADP